MINTTEFNTRLKIILKYYDLSASAFAEIIKVQSSSISHILSGRNNPSLEFITKMLTAFPDIDLTWILSGVGEFPKKTTSPPSKTETFIPVKPNSSIPKQEDAIERIVIFYRNGSFKDYSMDPSK